MQKRTAEEILKNHQKLIWLKVKSILKIHHFHNHFKLYQNIKKRNKNSGKLSKTTPLAKANI